MPTATGNGASSPSSRASKRNRIVGILTLLNVLSMGAIAYSNRYVAEASWPTMLVAFLPPLVWLLPSALLLFAKRWWPVNLLALTIGLVLIAGLTFNLRAGPLSGATRVVTFNVQHGMGGVDKAIDLIRREAPDIVCLQETDGTLDAKLREGLADYTLARMDSVAILTRLPKVGEKLTPLPNAPERPIARVDIGGPHPFSVFTAHMDASRVDRLLFSPSLPSHLVQLAKNHSDQADALLAEVEGIDRPAIVCGDFNGPPTGLRYARFRRILKDAWKEAGNGFGYTVPVRAPLLRIDWILVSEDWDVRGIYVPRDIASDHRAVVADLHLRER